MCIINDIIAAYKPMNEQEAKDKAIMMKSLLLYDDLLSRSNEVMHFTSSAVVVNRDRDRMLMVYHNQFDSWSWPGGHADGDENLLGIAIKEVQEETGVGSLKPLDDNIVALDILPVFGHYKRGEYVAPHLHLSVAYLLEADDKDPLSIKPDENSHVGWIKLHEIDEMSDEPHMKYIYNKVLMRLQH